ncbi:protocadherin-8-like [Paramormyrops kingsleyae]|uniref:protocadherin-8-like n=1 Tax=Paramormyrops kingsleyae TaxID=1676925 RepID=UPI003B96BF5A
MNNYSGKRVWFHCIVFVSVLIIAQSITTKYQTYEEDDPGTEIGNLSEDLKINLSNSSQTSFRFMHEANSCVIQMREMDGLLTVRERIDREALCPLSPRCLISFDVVVFTNEKFQLVHIEIEILDINDNSPQFPSNERYIEVSENTAVGTRLPLDVAADQDVGQNYIQSYQISFNSHFGIDVQRGEDGLKFAELVLLEELDREKEDSYIIQLSATDGGNPAKSGSMNVYINVLDYNDNSPSFEKSLLKVELAEDAPVGFLLLKVHAFDPDDGANGEVVYGFTDDSSTDAKRVFQIDSHSGAVTLKALVDYETKKSYEFKIQARDLGMNSVPSTCKITVEIFDVNDNAPEISIKPITSVSEGVVYITEAAAKDSFVALISTSDRDSGSNGRVTSSLQGHEHFRLHKAYGDTFMIVTTATLDRERIPEYNLTVVAQDLGSPPFKTIKLFSIRVSDENDNPPLFSKSVYEVSVMENNVPGSYISTVIARDWDVGDNGKVTYKLLDRKVAGGVPLSSYVSVHPVSGSLFAMRSFDYEALKQIEAEVIAIDSGTPKLSSTTLIRVEVVDQNDNSPYITYPYLFNNSAEVAVPYNVPAGYPVLRVKARDVDEGANGKLTFKIVEDVLELFSINKDTGDIVLKYGLTFMIGDTAEIKILVTDNGRSPLSITASIHFLVTEMQPSEDQIVFVSQPTDMEYLDLDVSLVFIIILAGGCVLLMMAIMIVGFSYLKNQRNGDNEPGFSLNHLESSSSPPNDKNTLQQSAAKYSDQLSVKDSGKGDSDFNDSDSDISGDGCRKALHLNVHATCSIQSPDALAADWPGNYCVIPAIAPVSYGRGNTLPSALAAACRLPQTNPTSRKDPGHSTHMTRVRGFRQSFTRTDAVPPLSYQHAENTGRQPSVWCPDSEYINMLREVATPF